MAVQQQTDISSHPYIIGGVPVTRRVELADDDARSGSLVKGTVMAYDPTNENWVPWTDEDATDGTQYPVGILLDEFTEAEVKAGPISDVSMIVGGDNLLLNEDLITFENSLTKDTIVTAPTNVAKAAWQFLADLGIHLVDTTEGTSYEA